MNNIANHIGVNEVGLLPKLTTMPLEQVWAELRKRGVTSVEMCTAFVGTEHARKCGDEIEYAYTRGKGGGITRGGQIYPRMASARQAGLKVISMHLMFCEAYPEYIRESLPYLLEIHEHGVEQFVVSCSFGSAAMVEEYLPHLEYAAKELKAADAVLCYHNHHQDSEPLENGKSAMEMVLEAPDLMLQLDTGWAWYGGMDAPAFMKAHGDRIASLHLKDLTADARDRQDIGRFTAIGSGTVNTVECLACMGECRLTPERLILDQDASAGDILDDISAGIAFVRENDSKEHMR